MPRTECVFVFMWHLDWRLGLCLYADALTRMVSAINFVSESPFVYVVLVCFVCRVYRAALIAWRFAAAAAAVRAHSCAIFLQKGESALIRAAEKGHTGCVRLLVDFGVNKEAKDKVRNFTCLEICISHRSCDRINVCLCKCMYILFGCAFVYLVSCVCFFRNPYFLLNCRDFSLVSSQSCMHIYVQNTGWIHGIDSRRV
jgi:hypothetical protein